MSRRIDRTRLARLRAAAQSLHRPSELRDAAAVARSIAGAQAQDKRPGLLQFRARSRRLTAAAVEAARVEERSLVRGWLMRGTVHLVPVDDYRWMRPLFGFTIAHDARRRLGQLGLDANAQQRALDVAMEALRADGRVSRGDLVARLAATGIEIAAQQRIHLMAVIVAEGLACIGPDEGGRGTLVLTEDWIGETPRFDRDAAMAELARRYLGAFAPARDRDLAKWSGLALGDCRAALERIASELVELEDGLLALAGPSPRAPRSPLVRLLPAFDTYLMGYESRSHAVDQAGERRILPGGGVLKPTLCIDGRLVGLWASKRSGSRLTVSIQPFAELADGHVEAIAREVEDIGRFEGIDATLRLP